MVYFRHELNTDSCPTTTNVDTFTLCDGRSGVRKLSQRSVPFFLVEQGTENKNTNQGQNIRNRH